jgi:hypothetical protein
MEDVIVFFLKRTVQNAVCYVPLLPHLRPLKKHKKRTSRSFSDLIQAVLYELGSFSDLAVDSDFWTSAYNLSATLLLVQPPPDGQHPIVRRQSILFVVLVDMRDGKKNIASRHDRKKRRGQATGNEKGKNIICSYHDAFMQQPILSFSGCVILTTTTTGNSGFA